MNNLWILAWQDSGLAASELGDEAVTEDQSSEGQLGTKTVSDSNEGAIKEAPKGFLGQYGQLIFIVLIFVVMYFVLLRGPKKKQQEHKQMVQTLKKNDRVRTIGGIIGTIVDIKDDEITLKIDESNNTKMKVVVSAIAANLSGEKKQ